MNGCSAGSVCAPIPESPFNGKLCIYRAGDLACPTTGNYVVKHVYYDGLTDDRGCSDCSCSLVPGTCSNAQIHLYDDTACTYETWTSAVPFSGCPLAAGVAMMLTGVASGASCTASGGEPTGKVTPSGPTTVCCSP